MGYRKLARIDGRNDSQMVFYDQVIPGSDLMGYVNADHWAIAVPIARSHATIGAVFVTQNAYPREALMEAMLRFIEEDLSIAATRDQRDRALRHDGDSTVAACPWLSPALRSPAFAWVYPEHRDIAVLGVEGLDPERRAHIRSALDRGAHRPRAASVRAGADTAQGVTPDCIDWAAMSAIAGDHSCSSKQMLDTVSSSEWILAVADVAAQLKVDLSRISKTSPAAAQQDNRSLIGTSGGRSRAKRCGPSA